MMVASSECENRPVSDEDGGVLSSNRSSPSRLIPLKSLAGSSGRLAAKGAVERSRSNNDGEIGIEFAVESILSELLSTRREGSAAGGDLISNNNMMI